MNYNIGDRIGDYEIVGILGAGGMGRVYKVRNVISDRVEALKVLLPELTNVPELADRFVREIKVLAGLEHVNIAALRTAQRVDDQLVMVMELVEGVTLQDRLEHGPVPVSEALGHISQVLSALSYAHARGVIHRDIKPANMMVTADGTVKLMDFGIAKAAGDRKLTMTGTTMGSLYYMSPEQIKGVELDARSDLYSLGVALYEIVTGARPFQGDSDFSIMSAHLEKQPVPPIQVDPKLPAELNEVILMSIAKEPSKRFQSADAFRAAVDSIRGSTPVPAPKPVVAAAPAAPSVRAGHRGLYMALGAALAVVVLAAGAIEIPKWLRTWAGEGPAPAQQKQEQVVSPASSDQSPAAQPAAETSAVPQPTAASPAPPPPAASARHVTAIEGPRQAQGAKQAAATAIPASSPAPAGVVPPPPAASTQPAPQAPPAGDTAKLQALKELRKDWPMLASRAGAVKTSLENLQAQQQRSGLGLRGDILASWKRMEHYLDQVDAAFSAKDPDTAKENMESAERELTNLEKFLGR